MQHKKWHKYLLTLLAITLAFTQCKKEADFTAPGTEATFTEKARQYLADQMPTQDFAKLDWNKTIQYEKDGKFTHLKIPLAGNQSATDKAVYLKYDNNEFTGNYFSIEKPTAASETITTLSLDNVYKCVARLTPAKTIKSYQKYEHGNLVFDSQNGVSPNAGAYYVIVTWIDAAGQTFIWSSMLGTGQPGQGDPLTLQQLSNMGALDYLSSDPSFSNPAGGSTSTIVTIDYDYLETTLALNTAQYDWLYNNPFEAAELYAFLQSYEDNIAVPTQDAVTAAKMALAAGMDNMVAGPYNEQHFNLIQSYNPQPLSSTILPLYWLYFKYACATIKYEHPEWGRFRVYAEAALELLHLAFDLGGFVPVLGEVFDFANGVIYTVQGDGTNAALSFSATIPIAGWAATSSKYAIKVLHLANGVSTTLKWIKKLSGVIEFGSRKQLRKVLNLATGNPLIAHHIIPWIQRNHDLVQKAALSDNAFHMNEALNGIPLSEFQHNYGHPGYLTKVETKLDLLWINNGQNTMSTAQARSLVEGLINDIRTAIINNPNTKLDDLIF
jgi:A nuclease family of the HNH/ENDO VII superfamily with conserved AHH